MVLYVKLHLRSAIESCNTVPSDGSAVESLFSETALTKRTRRTLPRFRESHLSDSSVSASARGTSPSPPFYNESYLIGGPEIFKPTYANAPTRSSFMSTLYVRVMAAKSAEAAQEETE